MFVVRHHKNSSEKANCNWETRVKHFLMSMGPRYCMSSNLFMAWTCSSQFAQFHSGKGEGGCEGRRGRENKRERKEEEREKHAYVINKMLIHNSLVVCVERVLFFLWSRVHGCCLKSEPVSNLYNTWRGGELWTVSTALSTIKWLPQMSSPSCDQ